jgi:hypothetical protein
LFLLVGCSTPASRIKERPEVFAALTPEQQAAVQAGRVELGFTPDMAYLALGRPDRTYLRTTAQGAAEVWAYLDATTRSERQMVTGTFRYRDAEGRLRHANDSVWVDVQVRDEYERLRLEFTDGRVSAIDRAQR